MWNDLVRCWGRYGISFFLAIGIDISRGKKSKVYDDILAENKSLLRVLMGKGDGVEGYPPRRKH